MYYLISALILIASILLILIVLVQNSKGGGMAANFSGSTQAMGARKTTDFLEKATWTLAIAVIVMSVLSSMVIPRNEDVAGVEKSRIEEKARNTVDPTAAPVFPTSIPGQTEEAPAK